MTQTVPVLFIGSPAPIRGPESHAGPAMIPSRTRRHPPRTGSRAARPWDIAISDFAVGDFGALAALRVIQAKAIDLPLIVVSGASRQADILAALKAGAADHLTRGNLMRLNAAVEREIRAAQMRRERPGSRSSSGRPRKWRRWAAWPAAWPTISTTCSR